MCVGLSSFKMLIECDEITLSMILPRVLQTSSFHNVCLPLKSPRIIYGSGNLLIKALKSVSSNGTFGGRYTEQSVYLFLAKSSIAVHFIFEKRLKFHMYQ